MDLQIGSPIKIKKFSKSFSIWYLVVIKGMIQAALYYVQRSLYSSDVSILPSAHALRHQHESNKKVVLTKPSSSGSADFGSNKVDPSVFITSTSNSLNASYLQGSFSSVSTSGTGQYVATVSSDAVYISSDYGQSYSTSTLPANITVLKDAGIAVASTTSQYVVMGCTQGLYVSNDYGSSFSIASNGTSSLPLSGSWGPVAISGDGHYAFVASTFEGQSLYTSNNYLASFVSTNSPFTKYSIHDDLAISTDGSILYAVAHASIYAHSTSGNSWTTLNAPDPTYWYRSIATNHNGQYVAVLSSGYSDVLYVSNNYGIDGSWITSVNPFSFYTSGTYIDVAMSSTGQYLVVPVAGLGVYYSSNYGVSLSITEGPPAEYKSATISADGNMAITVSEEGSVYQTNDRGSTWTPNHYDWVDVAMSQDGMTTFAIAGHSFYGFASMSTNNGTSWLQTGYSVNYSAPSKFTSVACDATCKHIITSDELNSYISVTANYGKTWVIANIGGDTDDGWYDLPALAVSSNGKYMTAGMRGHCIYRSTDYGARWYVTDSLKLGWKDVAMSSSGQYQVAVSTLSRYDDSKYNLINETRSLINYDYIVGEGYIYRSSDYGATWKNVSNSNIPNGWTSVASDSEGINLIATASINQTVHVSSDSGASWKAVALVNDSWVSCAISSSGNIMYVVSSTGLFYSSSDTGTSWTHLANTPIWSYRSVASDSTGQYLTLVAMSGPVLKSSDYGSTWTTQNIVFSTTNDFGTYVYWYWLKKNGSVHISTAALIGILIAILCGCGCIVGLITLVILKLCNRSQTGIASVSYKPANANGIGAAAVETREVQLIEKNNEV